MKEVKVKEMVERIDTLCTHLENARDHCLSYLDFEQELAIRSVARRELVLEAGHTIYAIVALLPLLHQAAEK